MLNITEDQNVLDGVMDNGTLWNNSFSNDANVTTETASHGLIRDENGDVICEGPSQEEYEFYTVFAWWLEGFGQILVGSLGKCTSYATFLVYIKSIISEGKNISGSLKFR